TMVGKKLIPIALQAPVYEIGSAVTLSGLAEITVKPQRKLRGYEVWLQAIGSGSGETRIARTPVHRTLIK
ncbi:MAG: hypothetical protein MK209_10330, partial [Planctomycetes bacterium]|nr:hypothetical protein [Planctomycetota bacterium]